MQIIVEQKQAREWESEWERERERNKLMQRPKFKEILKGKELLCNWKMVKESKFKKEKSKLKMEFVWITSNRDWMYRKHDWYQNMPNKLHVPFYSLLPTCHSLSLSLSLSISPSVSLSVSLSASLFTCLRWHLSSFILNFYFTQLLLIKNQSMVGFKYKLSN